MQHKKLTITAVLSLLLILSACHTASDANRRNAEVETVAYKVAENYFLRGNVVDLPAAPITSAKEFESLFGAATVMGEAGRPTPINFETEAVLAVTVPSDRCQTEMQVERLVKHSGRTLFSYKVIKGDTLSYQTKPVLILIVDRNDVGDTEFRRWFPPREDDRPHYVPTPQTGVF